MDLGLDDDPQTLLEEMWVQQFDAARLAKAALNVLATHSHLSQPLPSEAVRSLDPSLLEMAKKNAAERDKMTDLLRAARVPRTSLNGLPFKWLSSCKTLT